MSISAYVATLLSEELFISAAAKMEYLDDHDQQMELPFFLLPSPHLEVWVEHPVGEATHADPDALQHAVASQLVHDQGRLHLVVVVNNTVVMITM